LAVFGTLHFTEQIRPLPNAKSPDPSIGAFARPGNCYREDGSKRIADNALVALTLMIAESKPDEKDVMAQVVVNLINGYNF